MSSILLKTEEIRAMMDEVRAAQAACRIQAMCPHEEYEDGMYAFAVFQSCKLVASQSLKTVPHD